VANNAENGGKPFYPSQIKGNYNPNVKGKGLGLQGPAIDGDYTQFQNGPVGGGGGEGGSKKGGGLSEKFTAEYIWDINSLGLPPDGAYHVQLVIHDGDNDLGIDCIALGIGGAPASSQQPVPTTKPAPSTNKAPAKP